MSDRPIILQPVVSEKSFNAADRGVYTFRVARDANKSEIKKAVEERFDVKVEKVNVINQIGKRIMNRMNMTLNWRKDYKKAMVTLKGKDTIDIFNQ